MFNYIPKQFIVNVHVVYLVFIFVKFLARQIVNFDSQFVLICCLASGVTFITMVKAAV